MPRQARRARTPVVSSTSTLAGDPDFARTLRENGALAAGAPVELPPNHEAQTLDRTKRQLRRRSPLRLLAVVLTALAIVRLIQDTTFTVSPARSAGTALIALVCWILYGWHTSRLREAALHKPGTE